MIEWWLHINIVDILFCDPNLLSDPLLFIKFSILIQCETTQDRSTAPFLQIYETRACWLLLECFFKLQFVLLCFLGQCHVSFHINVVKPRLSFFLVFFPKTSVNLEPVTKFQVSCGQSNLTFPCKLLSWFFSQLIV